MEEELRQIMFKYRRDEISVDGALLRIETLINAPKNTIPNSEYKQCKNCTEKSCPGGVSFFIEKDYMYFKS